MLNATLSPERVCLRAARSSIIVASSDFSDSKSLAGHRRSISSLEVSGIKISLNLSMAHEDSGTRWHRVGVCVVVLEPFGTSYKLRVKNYFRDEPSKSYPRIFVT